MVSARSFDVKLEGARLSSAVRCPRMAVYQGVGVPQPVPTQEQIRYFRRGHALADLAKEEILEALAAEGREVIIEQEIPWPADDPVSVGHADLRVVDLNRIVEITTSRDCDLPEHKAVQATGYAVESGADEAVVLSIDPVTGDEREYPINIEKLAPRWIEIRDQVVAGIRDGVLPDRVCRHPLDGPAMFCPYSGPDGHCFQGWVPTVEHVEAPTAFQALAELEDRRAVASKVELPELDAQREELRAEILAFIETDGREHVAGGVSVKVTDVDEGETFRLAAMRKAGFELPEELRPFLSTRKASQRWTVRRVHPEDGSV